MIQLGDICTKASSNIAQKDLEDCDGIYPIYGASGLIKYIDFYQKPNPYVAVVKDGAGVGRIMLLPAKSSVIGTMQYILPNKGTNVAYLAYAMEHMGLAKYYTGATIPHIYFKDYCKELLREHCESEQQEIAAVLDKLTGLISLRKQQLAKLDELVKSRFVEMFGDPAANTMSWDRVPLSVCLDSIENGKSFVCGATARIGNQPALLKLSAATYGVYRPEENKAILDETQFVEDAEVKNSDLLFTRKNTPELVGMCAFVYDTPSRLMMPDLIFRLNTTDQCDKIFLWKLINHELFRSSIQAIATGSAKSMSNISKERLLHLEIILPPLKDQHQFASFVTQVDQSKSTIQQSLAQLETLKKSLMQQYFS